MDKHGIYKSLSFVILLSSGSWNFNTELNVLNVFLMKLFYTSKYI